MPNDSNAQPTQSEGVFDYRAMSRRGLVAKGGNFQETPDWRKSLIIGQRKNGTFSPRMGRSLLACSSVSGRLS
jgi:hypothetical protein